MGNPAKEISVEIFVLCDAATEQTGKLNLLGTFDTVFSKTQPTTGIQCSLAGRIRFAASAKKKFNIKLLIRSKDGVDVVPPYVSDVEFAQKEPAQFYIINLIGRHNLVFPSFADYDATLLIDDQVVGWFPIHVKEKKD